MLFALSVGSQVSWLVNAQRGILDDEGNNQQPEDSEEDYNFGTSNEDEADESNWWTLQNSRTSFPQPRENDAANTIMQHDICSNIDVFIKFW